MTAMQVSELAISVNSGPTKFETVNCIPANDTPHAMIAGATSMARRHPAITTMRYAGMKSEIIAQRRPTIALSASTGKPVMLASVVTGMPIDPNATGAVLASRQMPAAKNGLKPSPASIAPETATGAPKPAAPSMKAPKEKAMNIACRRRSFDSPPTESLMTSNLPVSTARRYSMMAAKTIHAIGNMPNAAP